MTMETLRTAHKFRLDLGGEELVIETGKLAEQAGGAVTVQLGDTMIFATATMSRTAREGIDFFPLSVDYEEKLYAAGRIPGSFFRREGRPSEPAILVSRVIDRTLRPLFPKDMRNEVQVILMSFSHDQEHQVDMLGIIAASAALMISDIPWNGPVAGVRIGLIDDDLVVNPTHSEMENSILDLRVSGTEDAINMVECGAKEVDEQTMLKALALAQDVIRPIIKLQHEMREQVGKEKAEYVAKEKNEALQAEVSEKVRDRVRQVLVEKTDRDGRNEAIDEIQTALLEEYEAANAAIDNEEDKDPPQEGQGSAGDVVREEVRRRIVDEGIRPDGRDYTTIRALSAEVNLIPRVHGSGLFSRGQTQVLTSPRWAPRVTRRSWTGSARKTPSAICIITTSRPTAPAKSGSCAAPNAARSVMARWRNRAAQHDPAGGRIPVYHPSGE
jgi:polyribonucleotide nucleotidyltransferase